MVRVIVVDFKIERYDSRAAVHLPFSEHVERQRDVNGTVVCIVRDQFSSQFRHVERRESRWRTFVGSRRQRDGGDSSRHGGGFLGVRDFGLLFASQLRHIERHVQQFLVIVARFRANGNSAIGPVVLAMVPVELDQTQRLRWFRLDLRGSGGGQPPVALVIRNFGAGVQGRLVRDRRQDVRLRVAARRLGTVRAKRIAGDRFQAETAAGRHAVRAPVIVVLAGATCAAAVTSPPP